MNGLIAGIIVKTELKEINPPKNVQETMNKAVKAEGELSGIVQISKK